MNTLAPSAAPTSSRRPARAHGVRVLAFAALALATPLLGACSSDGGDDATGASTPPASAPAGETTSAPAPTIEANGDPFCDLAVTALEEAKALDATTGEFQALLTGVVSGTAPIEDLHTWGEALKELGTSSLTFYDESAQYVEGDPAAADFAATRQFVADYSIPLAQMAIDAPDGTAFIANVGAFVETPEVKAAITSGPEAAQGVSAYITERCPAN